MLTPSAAISAGAQWRVDGGGWKASGATVGNLAAGTHQVEFKTISGWLAPATTSASIVTGSTTTLTAAYVQPAALQITLTPSSGQWRIDGGAWRASGTTATGLTPASHTIEYAAVSGYAAPATEAVALTAGQTTPLARSYTQLASITVTITPSWEMWRVDGGTIVNSGATVGNLAPGSHTIDYFGQSGWTVPPSETVTLTAGQALTLSRSGTQTATLTMSYPGNAGYWRMNAGIWNNWNGPTGAIEIFPGTYTIEYSALGGWIAPPGETITATGGQAITLNPAFVQLGGVTVALTPSSALWNIDGNAWQQSGNSWSNLTPGVHTVNYSAVPGYITPAPESVTIVSGQTTAVSRTYVQLAQVTVALTPATAQWRIDGGPWQNSAATVANLALGSHTIDYSAVSGYTAPNSETITLTAGQALSLARNYVQLAQLSIALTPAGARWQVDGGAWQNSGAVASLPPGTHTVNYSTVAGYITPAGESISLSAGQQLSLTRNYVQLAEVTVTLAPTNAQWRIDGGAWLASGATAASLTPGTHTIDYQALTGYTAPASESITLTAGQSASVSRSYVQLAQVTVTLSPAGAQWQIDNGAWQNSGATLADVSPGSHTLNYSSVTGYITPASESVSVTSGQALSLSRTYTALASLAIALSPSSARWRIDGGAWQNTTTTLNNLSLGSHTIDYSAVEGYIAPVSETITLVSGPNTLTRPYAAYGQISVTLTPANAQWRFSTGPWQASGDTVTNIVPGTYSLQFAPLSGYTTPATESVTINSGQSVNLTRSYTQLAQLAVTLTPSNAQWRLNTGPWHASGEVFSDLPTGTQTLEFQAVSGYITPPSETITLVGGMNTLTRAYTAYAQVTVALTPAAGQWRIYPSASAPGGTWQNSGATVGTLAPGNYAVEYNALAGYIPPATETITLAAGESRSYARSYATQPAQINVALQPGTARWRVDGGSWQSAGGSLAGLTAGSHVLEFSSESGYTTPLSQTIVLNAGDSRNYSFLYTPEAPGLLNLKLTPAHAQWRVDGGAWNVSGATVGNLAAGPHAVEFSDVTGYLTPSPTTLNVSATETTRINWSYDVGAANFKLSLNPTNARWRFNGGPWLTITAGVGGNGGADYWLEYEPVPGYSTPQAEYVRFPVSATYITLNRTYQPTTTASVSVALNSTQGQWRIYSGSTPSGTWQNGTATVAGLVPGAYTIEYAAVAQLGSPSAEKLTLAASQEVVLNRAYTSFPGQVTATLTPASAQWRISPSGGPASTTWLNNGTPVPNLSPGNYVVEYSPVSDYTTPWSETITLSSAESYALTRSYQHNYDLNISLSPPWGQWRVDGGAWQMSDSGVWGLTAGSHAIEYGAVAGWVAPPSETINFNGTPISLYRTYTQLAQITVSTGILSGQWRLDGGPWQPSEATLTNVSYGVPHTIDFAPLTGWVAPPSETVTLSPAQSYSLYRSYTPLADITVSTTPRAQWRVDGGPWQPADTTVANLAYGVPHTIDFAPLTGWVAPASETVTLSSGQHYTLYRSYTQLAQITVSTYPASGQWRVDGGPWQPSDTTLVNISYGVPHTIDFAPLAGYITPASETVTLSPGQQYSLFRPYTPLAQISITTSPSSGQWRVDGGAWQVSGATVVGLSAGPHTVDFRSMAGYVTVPSETVTLYSGQVFTVTAYYWSLGVHRLRFFVHQDLAGSLSAAELRSRLAQYATHLEQVMSRESLRVFTSFDPQADVSIVSSDPFSGSYGGSLPDAGFELWVYATLTDQPATGSYGGTVGVDASGAGGARGVKFDQIYDPGSLAAGAPALAQYWRQLQLVLRQFEHTFGAGLGEYDSLGGLHDASGVAPIVADVAAVDSAAPDAFWSARFDYWTDPLTANAYANPRIGSPTSLATLLDITSFAPATRAVMNDMYRDPNKWSWTVPDLSTVVVKVVDAQSGAPIAGSSVRIWNRQTFAPPYETYEEPVTTTGSAGVFNFTWHGGSPLYFNSDHNAKLVKAYAPGYAPATKWVTIYDAQAVKLIERKNTLEVTISLSPQ